MFGWGSFGSVAFGSVNLSDIAEHILGGVEVSGTVKIRTSCACNFVQAPPILGGVLVSGTIELAEQLVGGVLVGGRVRGSILGDPFDGMAGYWLLDGEYDGTVGEVEDLSAFALDGTGGSGDPTYCPSVDSGIACSTSQHFSGRQWIELPQDSLTNTQALSVSLWGSIDPLVYFKPRCWYSRGYSTTEGDRWTLSLGHDHLNRAYGQVQVLDAEGNPKTISVTGSGYLERGRHYLIALSWQPGQALTIYVNGDLVSTKAVSETTLVPQTTAGYVGKLNSAQLLEGSVSEVKLRGVELSVAWTHAEYQARCTSTFFEIGDEFEI